MLHPTSVFLVYFFDLFDLDCQRFLSRGALIYERNGRAHENAISMGCERLGVREHSALDSTIDQNAFRSSVNFYSIGENSWHITFLFMLIFQKNAWAKILNKFCELDVWSRDLVVWVVHEPGGLFGPGFADGFVGREATQCLQAAGEVVGRHEVGEMPAEFVVALVVEALDGRLLDSAVHALDLAIRPRMPRLGQPMFDVEFCTGELEGMAQKRLVP